MISYSLLNEMLPLTDEEKKICSGEHEIDRQLYMEKSVNIIKSNRLLMSGKLITVRPHTRFVDFPEHTHNYIEIVYMCLGSTTHTINGKKIVLSEGELLFLSMHAKHSIKKAGERDIAANFIVLPEFFKSSLSLIGNEETPLKKFISDSLLGTGGPDFLHFKVSGVLPVQNLAENLIWGLMHNVGNKRMVNRTTMELLFMQIISCTDNLEYENAGDEAVMKALKYAEDNYKSGSLSCAAELFHYDVCWLSREIKQKTGYTFTEIIQEKRLSQAIFYLVNTNMKISDIAQSVGYNNLTYFYKLFSAKFGMSPKKYRICNKG